MAAHIPDECLLALVHMYVLNTQVSPELRQVGRGPTPIHDSAVEG
jgi:hypothetical protein